MKLDQNKIKELLAAQIGVDKEDLDEEDTFIEPEKIEDTDLAEFEKALALQKEKNEVEIDSKIFDVLKKEYGNFEIAF